ncbi:MAG: ComF family protein [Ruminococcus sp.]|nr:ComF family protein [Ruminococcus sp.]
MKTDNTLQNVLDFSLDIFFPNRCPCCGDFIAWNVSICDKCKDKLSEYRCNLNNDIKAAYYYDGIVVDGIYALKFAGSKNFAKHCVSVLSDSLDEDFDIIVPVPIGKKRLRKRGYNQAEVIAKYFSDLKNIPVEKNALIRVLETVQHKLTQKERIKNAEDSYQIGKTQVSGKRILLVDDVYTTGATSLVCKNMLLSAGASHVTIAVCAKTYEINN